MPFEFISLHFSGGAMRNDTHTRCKAAHCAESRHIFTTIQSLIHPHHVKHLTESYLYFNAVVVAVAKAKMKCTTLIAECT